MTFKLAALGDAAVGKTSCLRRYREGTFDADYTPTLGALFSKMMVELASTSGRKIMTQLVLWDLAGQELKASLVKKYVAGARLAIIVYDVTRPQTFKDVDLWYNILKEAEPDATVAIVGNKVDLVKHVPTEEAKAYADSIDALFYETSAKTGHNIEWMFTDLIYHFFKKHEEIKLLKH
ncbi:MAG: GTP-binding protein [Candidatus Thorarchaeota archaeon]|nr:MAG: GTP-binding protein [Candidatus Thorarchaeota archaeon]